MKTKFIPLADGITQIIPADNETFNTLSDVLQQEGTPIVELHHSIFISNTYVIAAKDILNINKLL